VYVGLKRPRVGAATELFALPPAAKASLDATKSPLWRGYISTQAGLHTCAPDGDASGAGADPLAGAVGDSSSESLPTNGSPPHLAVTTAATKMQPSVDQKESFTIGAEGFPAGVGLGSSSSSGEEAGGASSPMHGPNQWPLEEAGAGGEAGGGGDGGGGGSAVRAGWQRSVREYWNGQLEVTRTVARGLALSLGLDEHFFAPNLTEPCAQMVLLKYPPPPPPSKPRPSAALLGPSSASDPSTSPPRTVVASAESDSGPSSSASASAVSSPELRSTHLGCGAHTDCGFLTVLSQTGPGLEVKHASGRWVAAPPVPGALVVNLGDLAERWTNDAYKSTWHRVYNGSTRDRYSIPFFCNCNFNSPVECIVAPPSDTADSALGHARGSATNRGEDAAAAAAAAADSGGGGNAGNGGSGGGNAGRSLRVAKYEATTAGAYIMEKLGLMRA